MSSGCVSPRSAAPGTPHVPTRVHGDVQGCLPGAAKQTGTCRKHRCQRYTRLCFPGKAATRSPSPPQPSRGARSVSPLTDTPEERKQGQFPAVPAADVTRTPLPTALLFWPVFAGAAVGLGNLCVLTGVRALGTGRRAPNSCSGRRAPGAQLSGSATATELGGWHGWRDLPALSDAGRPLCASQLPPSSTRGAAAPLLSPAVGMRSRGLPWQVPSPAMGSKHPPDFT